MKVLTDMQANSSPRQDDSPPYDNDKKTGSSTNDRQSSASGGES